MLLLTNTIDEQASGGRELLCKLNRDTLRDMYADRYSGFEIPKVSIDSAKAVFNAFKGHIDGVSTKLTLEVIQEIEFRGIEKIFVDGSNFGELVRAIKKRFPKVRVYTFFHNVEAKFFLGSLRQSKTLHALAVLMVNYLAERKAVRYSDQIICLNERDSDLLERVYGRAATDISPMALEDKLPSVAGRPIDTKKEKFALFVGGTFYANRMGVAWFVKNVAPHIHIKTCIVGRGFEKYRDELEIDGKVEVIGEVDSLAQWYRDAYFVIAPIFDGSGMKTKVAEALMHGKTIIGTPEAFTGYEEIADQVGRVCSTADDFVTAIESADEIVKVSFDKELRAIYEKKYSYAAARLRLERIMA